ncbi:MAG TPA: helix-turn-helix domain-containing protein [Solirubrobacteraceae bacterium]|nr:helix-turn-helix domain-containing protein [Solirubrobacteraceae bacterium]
MIGESPTESESQPEARLAEDCTAEVSGQQDAAPPRAGQSIGERPASSSTSGTDSGERLVAVTLSRNQVDHVVRAALGDGAMPSVMGVMASTGFHRSEARQVLGSRYRDLQENRRLSRSLLAGLLVLSCFPPEGVDVGIKDISQQLELNTSTVHRYVLTLVAAGLLERDPETRRYRLLAE